MKVSLFILLGFIIQLQLVFSQDPRAVFTELELDVDDGSLVSDQVSNVELTIKLTYDPESSTSTETGTKLWRAKVWASTLRMGGGQKLSFQKQVLSLDQAGTPITKDKTSLIFEDIQYSLNLTGRDCSAATYICVRFHEWTEGPTVLLLKNGREIIRPTKCAAIECSEPAEDPCSLEPVSGFCLAYFPRYFFNSSSGACEKFIYGGCGGNSNNFMNLKDCEEACSAAPQEPQEPAETGCGDHMDGDRWIFRPDDINCMMMSCDNGEILQAMAWCMPPACDDPVYPPLSCCPVCPAVTETSEELREDPSFDHTTESAVDNESAVTEMPEELREDPSFDYTTEPAVDTESAVTEMPEELGEDPSFDHTTEPAIDTEPAVTEMPEELEDPSFDHTTEPAIDTEPVVTENPEELKEDPSFDHTTEPAVDTEPEEPVETGCGDHIEGDTWISRPDDINCMMMSCDNGEIIWAMATCMLPECDDPVYPPLSCCPVCSEDACEGHNNGESWEIQPCEECTCVDGSKICASPDCAPPPCDKPLEADGACCPSCPDIEDECEGHNNGESWEAQPCEICSCVEGSKLCASPLCALTLCNEPLPAIGACCPSCPEIEDECEGHNNDESWEVQPCEECTCIEGSKICASPDCALPSCDEPLQAIGACCPSCPEIEDECEGHSNGEIWEAQPCEMCTCDEGSKICASPDCAPPPCDEPLQADGACCPSCPEIEALLLCDGYADGDEWSPDPCSKCVCTNGARDCTISICPELGCASPETVEGECCKQCLAPLRARLMNLGGVSVKPRVWRANRILRPKVNIIVRTLKSSENVTGNGLWKMSFWLDSSMDGNGDQMFYNEQVLSDQQAALPLYSSGHITFDDIRISIGGLDVQCPDARDHPYYYCFKFQKGDHPSVSFSLQTPRQGTTLMRCIKAPCF